AQKDDADCRFHSARRGLQRIDASRGRPKSMSLGALSTRHSRNRPARRCLKRVYSLALVIVALEDRNQFSDLQQVADAFGEINKLNVSAGIARRGEEAHQGPNAAAIDVANFSKIQNKTIVIR